MVEREITAFGGGSIPEISLALSKDWGALGTMTPRASPLELLTSFVVSGLNGTLVRTFMKIFKPMQAFKWPLATLLRVLLTSPPWEVRTRDGRYITIRHLTEVQELGWKILGVGSKEFSWRDRNSGFIVHLTVAPTEGAIDDVFTNEEYKNLPVLGKTVIDVGCNIGDTCLYFAARGADKVYGYELFTSSAKMASHLISVNGLEDRVKVFNQGVGAKRTVKVDPNFHNHGASDVSNVAEDGCEIEIVPLDELIERHKVNDAILKMDCEGSEYEIIDGASRNSLRRFTHMQIEYHYGYKPLESRLRESGFKVSHTLPNLVYNIHASRRVTRRGYVFAVRDDVSGNTP